MRPIDEKRAQAHARLRAATRKVSRIKQSTGAVIGGTKYDPRVPSARIDRMTNKQLDAFISRVNEFTSRSTQFVGGLDGAPITRQTYEAYQRKARAYNHNIMLRNKKFDNVVVPNTGQTAAERRAMMTPHHKRMRMVSAATPQVLDVAPPQTITGEAGAKKLLRGAERRLERNHLKRALHKNRERFNSLVDAMGKHDIQNLVNRMSDDEFDFLWNETGFAGNLAIYYEAQKSELSQREQWVADVTSQRLKEAYGTAEKVKAQFRK